MTAQAAGLWWLLTFAPHPDTIAVRIIYQCDHFFAHNWFDVSPQSSMARVRRIDTTDHTGCWTSFELLRGDPADPTVGESTVQ